jgi:hypothetical protein
MQPIGNLPDGPSRRGLTPLFAVQTILFMPIFAVVTLLAKRQAISSKSIASVGLDNWLARLRLRRPLGILPV